jgi:hypothetical protein
LGRGLGSIVGSTVCLDGGCKPFTEALINKDLIRIGLVDKMYHYYKKNLHV